MKDKDPDRGLNWHLCAIENLAGTWFPEHFKNEFDD